MISWAQLGREPDERERARDGCWWGVRPGVETAGRAPWRPPLTPEGEVGRNRETDAARRFSITRKTNKRRPQAGRTGQDRRRTTHTHRTHAAAAPRPPPPPAPPAPEAPAPPRMPCPMPPNPQLARRVSIAGSRRNTSRCSAWSSMAASAITAVNTTCCARYDRRDGAVKYQSSSPSARDASLVIWPSSPASASQHAP